MQLFLSPWSAVTRVLGCGREEQSPVSYPCALWPSPEQRRVAALMAGGWQATHTVWPWRRYRIQRAYGRGSRAHCCERDSVRNSTQYLLQSSTGNAWAKQALWVHLHIARVVLVKCKLDIIIANKALSDPNLIRAFLKTLCKLFRILCPSPVLYV